MIPLTNAPRPAAKGVRIGHVHLKVADLDRAIGFYSGVLGFDVMQKFRREAAFLAAGGYHHHLGLNIWESAGGTPPPPGHTGLYHTAFLYPTRADLADAIGRRASRLMAWQITASRRPCICATRTAMGSSYIGTNRRPSGQSMPMAGLRWSMPRLISTIFCGQRRIRSGRVDTKPCDARALGRKRSCQVHPLPCPHAPSTSAMPPMWSVMMSQSLSALKSLVWSGPYSVGRLM